MLGLCSTKHKARGQPVLSSVACGRKTSINRRDLQKVQRLGEIVNLHKNKQTERKKTPKTHDGLTANLNQDKNQGRND